MSFGAFNLALSSGLNPATTPAVKPSATAAFLHCLYDITHASPSRLVYVEQVTKALRLNEAEAESTLEILVAEQLVRLRLQCVLSITKAGIDAVIRNLHKSEPPPLPLIEELPASIATVEPVAQTSLSHSLLGVATSGDSPELPPEPAQPVLAHEEREDLELKLICEAIGLDPHELDSRPSPPSSIPDLPNGHHAAMPITSSALPALPDESGHVAKTLTALMLQLSKFGLSKDDLAEAEAEIATATAQLLSPRPKQPIIAASLITLLSILDATPVSLSIDLQVSLTEIRLFLAQLQA